MTPTVTFHALFADGATYRVMYDPNERKTYLATVEGGFMSVPYLVNGAEFVRYDFHYVPPKGLRGCDWALNVNRLHQYLSLLTPPVKPATSPTPISQESDSRLHVERLPGESGFAAMQRAYAEQEIATQRKHREAARAEINNQPPDAAKVARAETVRRLNAHTLRQMMPPAGRQFSVKGD